MPFQMFSRADWGAREPAGPSQELTVPIKVMQLVNNTECDECFTEAECKETVLELQKLHIEEDQLNDINFNFLIGGDGNVYEGRGWNKRVQKHPHWEADPSKHLVIGYIGMFNKKVPTDPYLQIVQEFVERYTQEGQLSKDSVELKV